ncbi:MULTISPECIES: helix-turn-helix domain-containing protein [unclassified Streptomyces]|uniref:helix-turn-helix domain-containing protein n=1 Tax=unclassified Streptomyces TaxID=2593676 RepID=UPI001CBB07DD|nr:MULTISPECIES: helix-turn-helix domain-containing protein [unclassified Streptomyces]WPO69494.1 helix-turn-helix domain-containing protein [Streptomyces sp. KN37]
MSRVPGRTPGQAPDLASPSPRSGWLVQMLSEMPETNDRNHVYLGVHVRGPVTVVHGRAQTLLEPNDLVFCDPARQHMLRFGEDCQMIFFRVPRCYLGVTEPELNQVLGVPVRGGEGIGALASDFLTALAAKAEFRRSTVGDRRARTAVHLLSVLVMELLEADTTDEAEDASGAANEMLSRIHGYIEEHLMDPDLSPESIARAHHISVRYLQKLFQNDGSTVSHWVRRRRLEFCRLELGRSNRRITMAAVAHRWGFSSPSHFSRTFRGAYGMSPSEWQALATSAFTTTAGAQDERRR